MVFGCLASFHHPLYKQCGCFCANGCSTLLTMGATSPLQLASRSPCKPSKDTPHRYTSMQASWVGNGLGMVQEHPPKGGGPRFGWESRPHSPPSPLLEGGLVNGCVSETPAAFPSSTCEATGLRPITPAPTTSQRYPDRVLTH